jgi:hypothetical protein
MRESRQPSIQFQLLPHNLRGLCAIHHATGLEYKSNTHQNTIVFTWSLKELAIARHHTLHVCLLHLPVSLQTCSAYQNVSCSGGRMYLPV